MEFLQSLSIMITLSGRLDNSIVGRFFLRRCLLQLQYPLCIYIKGLGTGLDAMRAKIGP